MDSIKHSAFIESLKEGDTVECTYELISHSGSYAQISKIKVCIRKLAVESGEDFDSMELIVKKKSGLIIGDKVRSFADCSKEELAEAIKVIIEIGNVLGVNCN